MESIFQEDTCDKLRDVGYVNFFVSILIVIGLFISYMPQHYRIISRGTSEGISPYFILLGVTSATAQFANILTLPESRHDAGCCSVLSPFECTAAVLGIVQIGVQWICFTLILCLFLVFFRREDVNESVVSLEELDQDPDQPTWRTALGVAGLCLLHGLAVIVITALIVLGSPGSLGIWANTLGIMASALAAVQYLPQIWTTYRLKHAGSLSIPMMCIQTPGGFVFAASLFARNGWIGWSSWAVYVLTAFMQGILLCMAVSYEYKSSAADGTLTPERPYYGRRTTPRALESPGPYSAHLQAYAETQEEIERALDRESVQGVGENQPLLAPGGIGSSGVR